MSQNGAAPRKRDDPGGVRGFVPRALVVIGLATLTVLLLLGAWRVRSVVFLLFLGILLAVFWRGLARPLARWTPLPMTWAVGVVIVLLAVLTGLLGWFFAPPLVTQLQLLVAAIPEALGELERTLENTPLGRAMHREMSDMADQENAIDLLLPPLTEFAGQVVMQLFGTFAATAGVITNLVFLFFTALFFALHPDFYRGGVVALFPKVRRARLDEVLREAGETLWFWLLGRFVAMIAVGLMVTLGLWALDMPLALLLGFLAFLLDFIPYVGPFAASVPALLLAFTVGPWTFVWVALLYTAVQQIESYLVTPVVQQRAVELPPILTLVAIFGFGGLFGLWGLLVSTPLMAVILVFVRRLYLEDVLGDAPSEGATPPRRPILVRRRNA
jgi:predicted PurR-regulated permease PerM